MIAFLKDFLLSSFGKATFKSWACFGRWLLGWKMICNQNQTGKTHERVTQLLTNNCPELDDLVGGRNKTYVNELMGFPPFLLGFIQK